MRGVWLVVALGLVVGSVGCTSTPKREMRQPIKEELVSPTDGYRSPPDYTRDQPVLTPKQATTGLNSMPGIGGANGPGAPGAGMAPGGMRR